MKKLIAGLAAAALAAGVATATTAGAAQGASSAPERTRGYTPPSITWGECDSDTLKRFGAECGTLVVPQDYDRPDGKTIGLAVSRVKHTTPDSQYQGVMLTNPGGPGGSGLVLSIYQNFVPDDGGASYDWIGFDPRGVGSSSPSLTCNTNFFHGDRPPYRPTTRKILKRWVARSKAYAADCATAQYSGLFKHVKTTDTIKDMESLRKALGEKQINFYGFSYGTYLGQVYATLHPNRVRRFVWDGTVDGTQTVYKSNQDQDVAFEKTSRIYFAWLAKYSSVYHVGNTPAQVRRTYYRVLAKLDRPGQAAEGVLGGDELTDVFTSAGYYVYDWEDIGAAWSKYVNDGDASDLVARYLDSNTPGEPGADNGYALYLGTQCTDQAWPRNQAKLNRDNWRLDVLHPFLTWSNAWFNGPCAYWKFKPGTPVSVNGAKVKTPILMIGETYDAATPFKGSYVIRNLFPTASLIEGVGGSTHAGSLSGVACTDDTIASYLKTGAVPARKPGRQSDLKCPPVPQPDPTAPAAQSRKATTGKALPRELREALQRAQVHVQP